MESSSLEVDLSLPEYLLLLLLEGKKEGPTFDPFLILSLLVELAYNDIITLKPKMTWLLTEKQVIVLTNPSLVSNNSVLELMIDRLKNQKHDHSVQQWADHWIGNTWKELLFPQHPTETLKLTITERLTKLGLIDKNKKLTNEGATQVEFFKQLTVASLKADSSAQGKPLLLFILNPSAFREAFFGQQKNNLPLNVQDVIQWNLFNNQTKAIVTDIQQYLTKLKQ